MSDQALLSPGDVVDGYQIESLIGHGGMAVVYRGRQMGTRRACALKFIRPRMLADPKMVEQFVNEARVAGRIPLHPNIVTVFEAGMAEQLGVPFIAMELLEGEPLDDYLRRRGALPLDEVATLMEQLADALDTAHAADVVHRDLTPRNIHIHEDRRGRPRLKVLDFGIAKFLDTAVGHTATQIGSAFYSAPEQLGARLRDAAAEAGFVVARGISIGTDIWPLGLIALELLAGIDAPRYWGGDVFDHMTKAACRPREAPSLQAEMLPSGFDAWFTRCTAHDAADRWPSAGAAVDALLPLLESSRS